MHWKFYNLFKIDWENPLEIWEKYGRRYFMKPKMKFRFFKRKYHGVDPMNIWCWIRLEKQIWDA